MPDTPMKVALREAWVAFSSRCSSERSRGSDEIFLVWQAEVAPRLLRAAGEMTRTEAGEGVSDSTSTQGGSIPPRVPSPDLAPLLARCAAATPEPWQRGDWGDADAILGPEGNPLFTEPMNHSDSGSWPTNMGAQSEDDFQFVLHARTDLPAAIAALQQARALATDLAAALRGIKYAAANDMSGGLTEEALEACDAALAAYDARREGT